MRLINLTVGRNETNATADHNTTTSTAALSQSAILTITGLDDSKIKSYTELVVVGEDQSISGQENSSCAICLEVHNPEEKVRKIAKCGHFFHSDCIVLWLKKNSTCPVCRTLLSHVIRV
ncbi:RING/U-box superfamily protein [Abeliophyllum distichum]|uniref:RING-type E3 ubiquitin transferase n=1 Tax=Abeliophyllum distichum TaxID=126358 RepID=A0ABD1RTA7_9LAMI